MLGHITCKSRCPQFYEHENIWYTVQIMKPIILNDYLELHSSAARSQTFPSVRCEKF
jgi:hypothetical protein